MVGSGSHVSAKALTVAALRNAREFKALAAVAAACGPSEAQAARVALAASTDREDALAWLMAVNENDSDWVDLAPGGTCTVDSANVLRAHAASVQNQRRLPHTTATAPATGTSRTNWRRRECTRVATTPHPGHPAGAVDPTTTTRAPPGRSSASITR